jgi:signal transduction histidine kinase
MNTAEHGTSLTRRLVIPVIGLVLAAVLANVGFAAWLAARRSLAAASAAQERVAAALESSRVALSPQVLDALRQLTGSHFVVWNTASRSIGISTLPPDAEAAAASAAAAGVDNVVVGGRHHRVGTVRSQGPRPESVLVLTPVRGILATAFDAAWPVLAVATATLAVLVPLGLRTTRTLAARIGAVERHVARIAQGEFGQALVDAGGPRPADEIGRLVAGVNRMSATLESLRGSLVAGERQRLLGQLAAGFAHELRNAITGARLAIDLHRRRCHPPAGRGVEDDGLVVAVRQLAIVEEEVRGLLALGKPAGAAATAVLLDIAEVCADVRDLTAPRCAHVGVRLDCEVPAGITLVGRREALRAALVNLAINGIDAAGPGGAVRLVAGRAGDRVRLVVEDSGPGPAAELADTLHEPFVTGKPEGIGLGLAVAKAVAEEHGGDLTWSRSDGLTRFAISLPAQTLSAVIHSPGPPA